MGRDTVTSPLSGGVTPVYGLRYILQGQPARWTRQYLEENALAIEAALIRGGIAPPNAADLATLAGRVTALEAPLPLVVLRQSASTSHATGWTTINWQAEDHDPDGLHDPAVNPSRITIRKKGLYRIRGQVAAVASASNYAGTKLLKNAGATTWASTWRVVSAAPNIETLQVRPSPQVLLPGDYLEVQLGLTASATANTAVGGVDGNGSWLMAECLRLLP